MDVTKPSRSGNVFEATIAQLLRAIRLGQYLVGDKLPAERELAAHLGVSRATLRQALGELQTAGIVEVTRGRYGGTVVTALPTAEAGAGIDSRDLDDVLAFRRILECAAAKIAAGRGASGVGTAGQGIATVAVAGRGTFPVEAVGRREVAVEIAGRRASPAEPTALTSAEVMALKSAEAECRTAAPEHFRALDSRFHLTIAELTEVPSLVQAAAATRDRINALLDQIPFIHTNIDHACRQHRDLMHAILDGDPASAEPLAADHARGTEELLRGFLEPDGP